MHEFRCLYLEDDDDDYETFKQMFERAMLPTKLIITRAKTTAQAFEKLDARGKELQILFADLLMPDSKEGLNVVEDVTRNHSHILIIGVSKAEGSHPGTLEEFKRRAGEVYWFFDKRRLKDVYPLKQIRSEIVSVAIKKGFSLSDEDDVRIQWKPNEIGNERLDAEVESIGVERLGKIAKMISPESVSFTPFYVAPGMSGATVLRMRGLNTTGKQPRNHLVKFSPHRSKLEKELAAAPKEGDLSSDIYVPYQQGQEPWNYEGIYAIAARFEEDAITLEEWLTNPDQNPEDTVEDVFNELFIQGLGKAYADGSDLGEATAMEKLAPSVQKRARILIGLDLIVALLAKAKINIDLAQVQNFVRLNGQINTHPPQLFPRGTSICWSHGDLHSRNILIRVSSRSRPVLIDAGDRRECHWASDPARLCADLWLRNWDGNANSHFWDQLPAWREQVQIWLNDASIDLDEDSGNVRVWQAMCWMRDNLARLFDLSKPQFARWQFELNLALEFLSMSAHADLPMPKRCLGVLAANDILAQLDRNISWR